MEDAEVDLKGVPIKRKIICKDLLNKIFTKIQTKKINRKEAEVDQRAPKI
jgi:hypothetical protein